MRVFLSWSGELSHRVAIELQEWLPNVIQAVIPWVSSEDIDKGMQWGAALAKELEENSLGVLCLTQENVVSQWLNFEAGALSKSLSNARVIPLVFEMRRSEVTGPITQFQSVLFEHGFTKNKEEMWKLINSINHASTPPCVADGKLSTAFEKWWPDLESELAHLAQDAPNLLKGGMKPKQTDTSAVLEEVLRLTRDQHRWASIAFNDSPTVNPKRESDSLLNWLRIASRSGIPELPTDLVMALVRQFIPPADPTAGKPSGSNRPIIKNLGLRQTHNGTIVVWDEE